MQDFKNYIVSAKDKPAILKAAFFQINSYFDIKNKAAPPGTWLELVDYAEKVTRELTEKSTELFYEKVYRLGIPEKELDIIFKNTPSDLFLRKLGALIAQRAIITEAYNQFFNSQSGNSSL